MPDSIYLRPVEIGDLSTLLAWENNEENWSVSETNEPYTEEEIADFIVDQQNYKLTGQLRLMICLKTTNLPVGAIDLYQIDFVSKIAGVGILIEKKEDRRKGYALKALQLIKEIAIKNEGLNQLFCVIHQDNHASIKLFEKAGFKLVATNQEEGTYRFECLLD